MRRIKPLSIYPPPELRSRIETVTQRRGRSLNQQIIRVLSTWVVKAERRDSLPKVGAQ
jgi:hypothetical protein